MGLASDHESLMESSFGLCKESGFPKSAGTILRNKKAYSIWGSTWGSSHSWKLPDVNLVFLMIGNRQGSCWWYFGSIRFLAGLSILLLLLCCACFRLATTTLSSRLICLLFTAPLQNRVQFYHNTVVSIFFSLSLYNPYIAPAITI